jgi:hypothetical protein
MTAYVLHRLWPWFPAAGLTLGKHVFLKRLDDEVTLAHELVHVRQQADWGLWFFVAYILLLPIGWNPWRREWEAEAFAVHARHGYPIEGDRGLAAMLAGAQYGWCCRQDEAAAAIRKWAAAAEGVADGDR